MKLEAAFEQEFPGFRFAVEIASSGPVLGVFGPSASGKTTLLHGIAGLRRTRAARVVFDGRVLADTVSGTWVPPERRKVAMVMQDALLFPRRNVEQNLAYAPGARDVLTSAAGRAIVDLLRLDALLGRGVEHLSGGEKQRVALGRALLAQPDLLLLDEPTHALDADLARDVVALLLQAKRELGVAMVFVTHRVGELLALCDDCVVMVDGRAVAQGPPVQVLARPRAMPVANLVGVDNLLRLPVLRRDEAGGVTLLDLGAGETLAAPLAAAAPGSRAAVGFYADDVMLCLERPAGISARNALRATIVRIDTIGHDVLVEMRIGDHSVRARLTPAAANELGLAVGRNVVALVKTAAVHWLG